MTIYIHGSINHTKSLKEILKFYRNQKLWIDGAKSVWLKIMWVYTFVRFVHTILFILHFIRTHGTIKERKKCIWHEMNEIIYRENLSHPYFCLFIVVILSFVPIGLVECSGLFEKKSSLYVWRKLFWVLHQPIYATHMIHCENFKWLQLSTVLFKLSKQSKRSHIIFVLFA